MSNISRLTFVALSVSDLEKSVSFYRDVLGIPIDESSHDSNLDDPWYGGEHAAYTWTDDAFIHFALYPSRAPERPVSTSAQVGFHVENFDSIHQAVLDAGINIVQQPRQEPWGFTARYLDPDGNIVSITKTENR